MQCALLCETAGFQTIGNTDLVYGSSKWLQSSRTAPPSFFGWGWGQEARTLQDFTADTAQKESSLNTGVRSSIQEGY